MNTSLASRALFLKKVRAFFDGHGYIEVDAPALSPFADINAYIDPLVVSGKGYLHTSPEYAMKEILSWFRKDIYFLGHVFRREEKGRWHNEEFTMIEWYRTHTTESFFLEELKALFHLFLGPLPVELLDYDKAFSLYAKPLSINTSHWSEEEIRHYTWGTTVEPHLGQGCITIIQNFPKEDASLSKLEWVNGKQVAKRFECFHKGLELGNGFYELTDPEEQRKRFEEDNQKREALGKESFPITPHLLGALAKGLPENTYGMALGFDRLLALHLHKGSVHEVLPLPYERPISS